MSFKEITIGLYPINYFDFAFKRRTTFLLGDMSYGEIIYYIDGRPEFYFNWFDKENYGETIAEIENLIALNKANNWRTIKRLAKCIDKRITNKVPLLASLSNNNSREPQQVTLKILPVKELWQSLSEKEKIALLS